MLAINRDGERFVFLFDNQSLQHLLQTLGRFAADPELDRFTWHEAAVLSQKSRKLVEAKA